MIVQGGLPAKQAVAGLAVLLLAFSWVAYRASPAQAHAELLRSEPAAGSELQTAPGSLELTFSEGLEAELTSLELFAASGERLELPGIEVGGVDASRVTAVAPSLGPGRYTLVYRTVSQADGHVTVGSFTFTVLGAGGAAPGGEAFVPAVTADVGVGATLGRWLRLIGLAVLTGGGIVTLAALRGRSDAFGPASLPLYSRVALVSVAVAIAGDALLLLAQHEAIGGSLSALIGDSRFGDYWVRRQLLLLVAAVPAAVLWLRAPRRPGLLVAATVVAALGALFTITMVGHAAGAPGRAWALAGDFVHLGAATCWLGGVSFVALLLGRARVRHEPVDERATLQLISGFSIAAAISVVILGASGLLRVLGELPSLTALTSTTYGRWLIVKLLLLAPILAIALVDRRIVGRWSAGEVDARSALRRLRGLLPAEAALGGALLFSVAALGQAATPRSDFAAADGGALASPAPQLSSLALGGGALAIAAAGVAAVLYVAPMGVPRAGSFRAGAALAFFGGVLLVAAGGTEQRGLAPEPAQAVESSPDASPTSVATADCERLERGANLAGCDLRDRELRGLDLRDANLSGATLAGADLFNTRLQGATLIGADLRGADLTAAYLQSAVLNEADLTDANLRGANAVGAVLQDADLTRANLLGVDFAQAYLAGANLDGAAIEGTTFTNADLTDVNWANTACPEGPEAIPGGVYLCAESRE